LSIRVVIVDLESIQPPKFPAGSESSIETLANTIVNLRGLLHLPVLYSLGIEEYELISGHTEFYAYLKAREFDDSLPDRLTVLVADKKNEVDIQKQLQTVAPVSEFAVGVSSQLSSSASKAIDFSNLEAKLERLFSSQQKSIESLQNNLINKIDSSLPEPLPILVAFNRVMEKSIEAQILMKLTNFVGKTKASKICSQLKVAKEQGERFTSLTIIQKTLTTTNKQGKQSRLIGAEKMLEILDQWQQ
jgi:hypothetical protein